MVNNSIKLVLAIVTMSLFSSCFSIREYREPEVTTEDLYPYDRVDLDSTTLAEMPWDEIFDDPRLQALIEEALQNNLNLRDVIQQIRIAEADLYRSKMNLLPNLSASASGSYNNQSDNSVNFGEGFDDITIPPSSQYSISLRTSWEVDIWGKLTTAKQASYAALQSAEATRRAIQTSLIANVAQSYYTLLALDRQVAITKESIENRTQDVNTVRELKNAAVLSGVALEQSIANRYSAEVNLPEIKQQIVRQENILSLLLGRAPGTINRSALDSTSTIDSLVVGVPAQLLENRPDVVAAERNYRQAFALTNNAETYFYPSLTLTADGGFQSLNTSNLFNPGSIFYNLIGGLTQPIFNRGQNKARLKISEAQQQQALLNLKSTLLQAGSEVSNALSLYETTETKLNLRKQQITSLENAVNYARELLQYGEANYTDVLTAQQALLGAKLSRVNERLTSLNAGVELYRALGGGWDKTINH